MAVDAVAGLRRRRVAAAARRRSSPGSTSAPALILIVAGHAGAAGRRHLLRLPRRAAAQPVQRRLRRPRAFPRRCCSDRSLLPRARATRCWWTGALGRSSSSSSGWSWRCCSTGRFRGRGIVQALVFLPWAVPTFLSGLNWAWLFNPVDRPAAALAVRARPHVASPTTSWPIPQLAMWGPIVANVWWGIPFFAITLLAALQSIPRDLYEAAAIDGAGAVQRFTHDHAAVPRADHRHHRAAAHRSGSPTSPT